MLRKYKFVLISTFFVCFYAFFSSNVNMQSIEKTDIPSGIGGDIKIIHGKVHYLAPISVYIFSENKSSPAVVYEGIDNTIRRTSQNRQLQTNRRFNLGLQRVYLFSERLAKYGLKNYVDILFSNAQVNDMAVIVICKGAVKDVMKHKIKGYPSSSDYIEGMVKNASDFNFFSQNYKLIDMYVRVNSEGRSLVLPYVEVKKNEIKITGMTLFKKFKMVRKISIEESRTMNLLREDKSKGIISIKKSAKRFIGAVVNVKRKVHCEKKNKNYEFTIKLSLEGDIANNSIYKNTINNPNVLKKVEKDMNKAIEKMCYKFIRTMQQKYKIDCLELGRVGAAKYGRRKGINWDIVIAKAKIKVKADFKVKSMGRGRFLQ